MLKKINLVYVGETPTRVRTENNAEKIEVSYGDINSFDRKIADDLLRYKSSGFIETSNAEVIIEPEDDNEEDEKTDDDKSTSKTEAPKKEEKQPKTDRPKEPKK